MRIDEITTLIICLHRPRQMFTLAEMLLQLVALQGDPPMEPKINSNRLQLRSIQSPVVMQERCREKTYCIRIILDHRQKLLQFQRKTRLKTLQKGHSLNCKTPRSISSRRRRNMRIRWSRDESIRLSRMGFSATRRAVQASRQRQLRARKGASAT